MNPPRNLAARCGNAKLPKNRAPGGAGAPGGRGWGAEEDEEGEEGGRGGGRGCSTVRGEVPEVPAERILAGRLRGSPPPRSGERLGGIIAVNERR